MKNIIFTLIISLCFVGSAQAKDCLLNPQNGYVKHYSHGCFCFMENQTEIWKDVVGYEGLYQVSSFSRIRGFDMVVPTKIKGVTERIHKGKIMNPSLNKGGYFELNLCKNGSRKCYRWHRIVAQAFIPNPENKPHINHINSIRSDNRIENLEWVTNYENVQHMVLAGRNTVGETHGNCKITDSIALEILNKRKETGLGRASLQRIFFPNIAKTVIGGIIHGGNWKHIKIEENAA